MVREWSVSGLWVVREWSGSGPGVIREWSGSDREWFVSGPRVVHEVRVSQKMGGKDVINVLVCVM